MKLLLLGGSGFVGKHLCAALQRRGDRVVSASLRDPEAAAEAARACDGVVNLAGEPVAQRWSAAGKERIVSSRTRAPHRFLEACRAAGIRLPFYVSASAVGYYGTSESASFDEGSPAGDDFLARTCVAWEAEALRARELGARVAIVRTGIVLGTDGGALQKMLPVFRLGTGGIVGTGRQWLSWIHIADVLGIFLAAIDRGEGAYDATAPNPVTNAAFTQALAEALHRPAVFPVPTFALRLALGEGADVVASGQRVLPKRTTEELGYAFIYPQLEPALADLLAGCR